MRLRRADPRSANSLTEAGLFLILVAAPLVVAPFARVSFANPKFFVLTLGSVLIVASRPHLDRWLVLAAASWLIGLLIASAAGQDPWWSIAGSDIQNTGVITLGIAGLLLCTASSISDELRERLPAWIFWTCVVVGAVAVIGRFVSIGGSTWALGPLAATMGHRIYVGALMAVGAISGIAVVKGWHHRAGLLVIASALAVSAVRSAWVGAAVGIAVVLMSDRRLWRPVLAVSIPIVVVLAAWTFVSSRLPESGIDYSAAQRFAELDEGSAAQRPPAFRAYMTGFADDPVVGSGPATGWQVFLTHVRPEDITKSGRGFSDAHNIVAELAATSGLVGLLPLMLLAVLSASRLRRAPADRRWALGAAIALGIFHLLQPLNVVLTPLLFLLTGLALRSPAEAERTKLPKWVIILPVLGLVVASARLASSTLDRYAYQYASESSYRWALRIEPRALSTSIRFAKYLAVDARSGDRAAGEEARRVVADAIAAHPWHPEVRLGGADVASLLGDLAATNRLITEHLAVFPNDPRALFAGMNVSLRLDRRDEAQARARALLMIDPDSREARRIVQTHNR